MTQQQLPTDMPVVTNTDRAKLIGRLAIRFEQVMQRFAAWLYARVS